MLDIRFWQSILSAATNNNVSTLRTLLSQRPSAETLNHGNENGVTPLHVASRDDYIEVAKLLLNAGANVNAVKSDGWTPLLWASYNNNLEVAKLLITAGANLNATNNDVETALHRASYAGRLEVVKLLIEAGADLETLDKNGKTPRQVALDQEKNEIAELLSEAVKTRHANRLMKIIVGFFTNNSTTTYEVKPVNTFGELKAMIHKKQGIIPGDQYLVYKMTVLSDLDTLLSCEVSENDKIYIIRNYYKNWNADVLRHYIEVRLMKNSADSLERPDAVAQLNKLGSDGLAFIHVAATEKAVDLLQLLHAKGANLDLPSSKGETALHIAAKSGDLPTAEWLVKNGANVNASNNYKDTALHIAVRSGSLDIAKLLCAAGANVNAVNGYHEAPAHVAARRADGAAFISVLADKKAKIDVARTKTGETALFIAVSKDHFNVAETLLKLGADPTTRNAQGARPLNVALSKGHTRCVSLLDQSLLALTSPECANMPTELAELRSQVATLRTENSQLDTERTRLQSEVQSARATSHSQQTELDRLRRLSSDQQREISQLQATSSKTCEERDSLQSKAAELQSQLADVTSQLLDLTQDKAELDIRFNRASERIQELQSMCEQDQNEFQELRATSAALRTDNEQISRQNSMLTEKIRGMEAEVAQARDIRQKYLELKDELTAQHKKSEATIQKLKAENGRLRTDVSSKSAELTSSQKGAKQAQSDLAASKWSCEQLQQEAKKMETALAAQTKKNEELEQQNSSLSDQLSRLQAADTQFTAQHTELQSHCDQLESALEQSQATVTAQQLQLSELRSQNTTLEHEVTILRETVMQTKIELLASQRRCEQLQSEVQTPPTAAASSSSAVAELQRRLDTTQRRLDDAKEDRDDYIAKNAELRKQIKALQKASAACTTCDELREQLNFCTEENTRYQEAIRQLNEHVADLQDTIERGYY